MIISNQRIKSFKAIAVLLVGAIVLSGCSLSDSEYVESNTKELPKIKYLKEPSKGLCFAYVKSRVAYGYAVYSISQVDCKAAGL